ncbi:MAG: carbamoyltransferase HypF, partial [Bacteroidota bacterium]
TVWGGEVFTGSLRAGLDRVDHLRPAWLPGGDAAAQVPVQAAAGFLAEHVDAATLEAAPFGFPPRYRLAARLVERGVRTTATTSAGRLFDAAAALCGFARPTTYEGQAAAWLEAQARRAAPVAPYPCDGLDGHALLMQLLADRQRGRPVPEVARAFHAGLAEALVRVAQRWAEAIRAEAIVASGGVFQNALLIELLHAHPTGLPVWLPQALPPGDGGLALGQAALAC